MHISIPMGKSDEQRARLSRAEHRLKKFYQPGSNQLDPQQVRASRDFHVEHWLRMAETMIRKDHQAYYYGGLSSNLETTLAEYPADEIPPDLQQVILRDLAFLEGHVEAFRYVSKILRQARAVRSKEPMQAKISPGTSKPEPDAPSPHPGSDAHHTRAESSDSRL